MKAIEEIERTRRAELDQRRFEDFVKCWAPEDGDPRFVAELHHLIANAVEHRTNALGRMVSAALSAALTISSLTPIIQTPEKG